MDIQQNLKNCTVQNVLEIHPDSLEEVRGNLALEVPQWFWGYQNCNEPLWDLKCKVTSHFLQTIRLNFLTFCTV